VGPRTCWLQRYDNTRGFSGRLTVLAMMRCLSVAMLWKTVCKQARGLVSACLIVKIVPPVDLVNTWSVLVKQVKQQGHNPLPQQALHASGVSVVSTGHSARFGCRFRSSCCCAAAAEGTAAHTSDMRQLRVTGSNIRRHVGSVLWPGFLQVRRPLLLFDDTAAKSVVVCSHIQVRHAGQQA
jgi:hypothetical protein